MNPQRWRRINDLFERAAGLSPEQWEGFLARESETDPELANEVLRLLRAPNRDKFIEPPTVTGGAAPLPGGDPWIGRKLGDFELIELIGRGGMGIVFRARQLSLRRDVAVKILPASPLVDPQQIERFEREARAAAKLRHPNVVAIHAVGRESDLLYFAMELVDGPDLAKEIRRLAAREATEAARLPAFDSPDYVKAVVRVVEQTADALAYAHEHAILHRDIKPHNLLLDSLGNVRVVDFGLARDDGEAPAAAKSETHAGTAPYMSPEQARRSMHRVDARTDVYSLGVVLYELLALRRPFDGASAVEILHKIVHEDPPRLRKLAPRVPRDLELVCNTAMARELSDRYASAADFRDDLRRLLRHEAIVARGPSLRRRVRDFAARHRVAVGVLAAAAAAAYAGVRVGHARESQARLARLDATFRDVVALPDWDASPGEVVNARKALQELERHGPLPDEVDESARRFRSALESDRAARVARGKAALERGLAGTRGGTIRYNAGPSDADLGKALLEFTNARVIHGDDAELQNLANVSTTFPAVSIRLAADSLAAPRASEARAYARRIDSLACTVGELEDLGPLPLSGTRMPTGYWRIIVDVPDYGFSELARYLVPSENAYEIVARVVPNIIAGADMVAIQGGRLTFRRDSPLGCGQTSDGADFAAFKIDQCETSNRLFVEFLTASGRQAPMRWRELGWNGDWRSLPLGDVGDRWLDLPVAGISVADATACAEWYGKRLPSHVELERAQRGLDGALAPVQGLANVDVPDLRREVGIPAQFAGYLRNVLPVRAPEYQQHPEGLFHAYGNVAEFTESLHVEAPDGMLFAFPLTRIYLGGSWGARSRNQSLATHAWESVGDAYTREYIGMRCAKSAQP